MSKYKSYNKKPIVKYIHNKIFLFIMMFFSFKVNNYIDIYYINMIFINFLTKLIFPF